MFDRVLAKLNGWQTVVVVALIVSVPVALLLTKQVSPMGALIVLAALLGNGTLTSHRIGSTPPADGGGAP